MQQLISRGNSGAKLRSNARNRSNSKGADKSSINRNETNFSREESVKDDVSVSSFKKDFFSSKRHFQPALAIG